MGVYDFRGTLSYNAGFLLFGDLYWGTQFSQTPKWLACAIKVQSLLHELLVGQRCPEGMRQKAKRKWKMGRHPCRAHRSRSRTASRLSFGLEVRAGLLRDLEVCHASARLMRSIPYPSPDEAADGKLTSLAVCIQAARMPNTERHDVAARQSVLQAFAAPVLEREHLFYHTLLVSWCLLTRKATSSICAQQLGNTCWEACCSSMQLDAK